MCYNFDVKIKTHNAFKMVLDIIPGLLHWLYVITISKIKYRLVCP